MNSEWRAVKWRPVVAYSRHHMRGILGMVGKWAMFVLTALNIGIGETSVRGVTERVHAFNHRMRTDDDWRRKKKEENREAAKRRARGMRSRMKNREQPEHRRMERTVWDLTNFFIKVPRKDFFRNVIKELERRIEEACPGKPWF